jgi:hypothetical protein
MTIMTNYGPGEGLSGVADSYSKRGGRGETGNPIVDQNSGLNKPIGSVVGSEILSIRDCDGWGQSAARSTFDCSAAGEAYCVLTGGQTATPLEIKAIFGGGPDNVRIEASQEWNCRHKENSSTKPRTLSKSRKRSRDWTMRRYPCSVFNQPKKVTNDYMCTRVRRLCFAAHNATRSPTSFVG